MSTRRFRQRPTEGWRSWRADVGSRSTCSTAHHGARRHRLSDEADVTSPVMRRRHLGSRLREVREEAQKSLEEVAQYLECSVAKVSRIETGRVGVRVPDVRSMLDLYKVPDTVR